MEAVFGLMRKYWVFLHVKRLMISRFLNSDLKIILSSKAPLISMWDDSLHKHRSEYEIATILSQANSISKIEHLTHNLIFLNNMLIHRTQYVVDSCLNVTMCCLKCNLSKIFTILMAEHKTFILWRKITGKWYKNGTSPAMTHCHACGFLGM